MEISLRCVYKELICHTRGDIELYYILCYNWQKQIYKNFIEQHFFNFDRFFLMIHQLY